MAVLHKRTATLPDRPERFRQAYRKDTFHLTRCDDKFGAAAWKSHDWDALNRLHDKGYIGNPVNKNKSVGLTEEGQAKAEESFWKLFGKSL